LARHNPLSLPKSPFRFTGRVFGKDTHPARGSRQSVPLKNLKKDS
jgi:hypothetical protein